MKITLTQWEMAQVEAALRERVTALLCLHAEEDIIKQTVSLQRRVAGAQSVVIHMPVNGMHE